MARRARVKPEGRHYYHIMNRITLKMDLINEDNIKEMLLDSIERAAFFSGVNIFAFAIMDNHYHLLCEAGRNEDEAIPDESEIISRVAYLKGTAAAEELAEKWTALRAKGDALAVDAEIARLRARMGDLSEFVKTYTEVFSQRIRREKGYVGRIWQDRYKSVLVESGVAFQTIRKYIENNPVKANIVSDPKENIWCTEGALIVPSAPGNHLAKTCKANLASLAKTGDSPQKEISDGKCVAQMTNGKIVGSAEFIEEMAAKCPKSFGKRGANIREIASGLSSACGNILAKANVFATNAA